MTEASGAKPPKTRLINRTVSSLVPKSAASSEVCQNLPSATECSKAGEDERVGPPRRGVPTTREPVPIRRAARQAMGSAKWLTGCLGRHAPRTRPHAGHELLTTTESSCGPCRVPNLKLNPAANRLRKCIRFDGDELRFGLVGTCIDNQQMRTADLQFGTSGGWLFRGPNWPLGALTGRNLGHEGSA